MSSQFSRLRRWCERAIKGKNTPNPAGNSCQPDSSDSDDSRTPTFLSIKSTTVVGPLRPLPYSQPSSSSEDSNKQDTPQALPNQLTSQLEEFWVDRLTLQQFLGSGAFGLVFRAKHKFDQTHSALKIIFPDHNHDSEIAQKESRMLAQYDCLINEWHSNIIHINKISENSIGHVEIEALSNDTYDDKFHDFIAIHASRARRSGHVDVIYIGMELCGNTLRQWLNDSHEETKELYDLQVGIVQGLVNGLHFLHSRHLVHGDLNPYGIMFSRGYLLPVKMEGFDSSRLFSENDEISSPGTGNTCHLATFDYRAPEYDHRAVKDPRVDLYSLGLIIWEVLQLINVRHRKRLFDRLVNDEDESLVVDHPTIKNAKHIIIGLTKRRVARRTSNIATVVFKIPNLAEDNLSSWFDSASIRRYLGSGGFGFVFEVETMSREELSPSAVKISFPGHPDDTEKMAYERKCISREYENIVGKYHPNVMQIFELAVKTFSRNDITQLLRDVDDDHFHDKMAVHASRAERYNSIEGICIRMELCGSTLRQWLNDRHHISPEICKFQVDIVRGLIDGLKFLHSHKLIHRDLKPDNVMFSLTPNHSGYNLPIKIGDFGLCRLNHSELTMTNLTANVGTAAYRAAEVNNEIYGVQADLFSLGLIMWEVLQLIDSSKRKRLFERLVIDKEEHVVKEHPNIPNSKWLIINLTKRDVKDRLSDINLVVI